MGKSDLIKGKLGKAIGIFMLGLLLLSPGAGCGGVSTNKMQRIGQEDDQHLVDAYVEYLDTENPLLIDEIGEICPGCLLEDTESRNIDERILLSHVKDCEIDLSALEDKRAYIFDSDKYPLEYGTIGFFYIEPLLEEDVRKVSVDFNLEGPWDFSQQPAHPEDYLMVDTDTMYRDRFHEEFPEATHVINHHSLSGMTSRYVSKDEAAIYEYGIVSDFIRPVDLSEPNIVIEFPLEVGKVWDSHYEASLDAATVGEFSILNRVMAKGVIYLPHTAYINSYLVQSKCSVMREGKKVHEYIIYTWYVPYVGEVARIQSLDNEVNEVFTQVENYRRLMRISIAEPSDDLLHWGSQSPE